MGKKTLKQNPTRSSHRSASVSQADGAGGGRLGRKQTRAVGYQVRIVLRDVSPAVWRCVIVPAELTFEGLHMIIQVAMGWQNCHLYDFEVGGRRIGISDADFGDDSSEDAGRIRLRDSGLIEGETLLYRYDFGDGWEHDLIIEQVLGPPEVSARARCLDGARACPPEDCGGPYGYADLLTALSDRDHPEHEELVEWIGGDFDPERFDAALADTALGQVRR